MAQIANTFPDLVMPAEPGLFTRALRWAVDWNRARITRDSLMKLTDRELADVGVTRDQIDEIAARAFR